MHTPDVAYTVCQAVHTYLGKPPCIYVEVCAYWKKEVIQFTAEFKQGRAASRPAST